MDSRRIRLVSIVLAGLAFSSCSAPRKTTETRENPLRPFNVVVVTIDTLRADRLRCYGYQRIETPTLDGLAAAGALFEHAVAQVPLTPPSHACIFTGTYPTVHKVRNTGGFALQASSRTLAKILQEQGWDTAAFVGAAVLKKAFGFNQGFAVYDDEMPRLGKKHEVAEEPQRKAGDVVDRALGWLHAQSGKPFFLWVHLYDPHTPYDPPAPYSKQYQDRLYDGEIAYTDHELGRLIAALDKKSAPEKTLIVVLADHGESLGEHGEYTHGVFLYDSTLHIPLIMRGPGVKAGLRIPQQVRTIDILPTILHLMGGDAPPACQGRSVTPLFSGKPVPAQSSYGETIYPKMNLHWAELRSVRTDRWKYIRAPKPELYDLEHDPAETNNIIGDHPKEFRELNQQLNTVARTADGKPEKVSSTIMDPRTMEQLKSLGYLSGGVGRTIEMNGQGADPKDRVAILKLQEEATGNDSVKLSAAKRVGLLRDLIAADPENPMGYYELGQALERSNKYDEAMAVYRSAIEKHVETSSLLSRLGDLYLRGGDKAKALAMYEQASRLDPMNQESQTNLATIYLESGRIDEAERVLQVVVANAAYAPAYNALGLAAIQRQNPAAARGNFEKAVEFDPDLVEAQLNLGLIYRMAGEDAKAKACFQTFLAKASRTQYAQVIPKVKQELAAMR